MGKRKPVEDYEKELHSHDWKTRRKALKALGKRGEEASSAIPAIEPRLKDTHWKVRGWAALALGYIGPAASGSVPLVIPLLKDSKKTVRNYACLALGMIGQEASPALPLLIKALDEGRLGAASVLEALGGIGPPAAVYRDRLLTATEDEDFMVRFVATRALSRIFGHAPELRELTETGSPRLEGSEEPPPRLPLTALDSPVAAHRARAVKSLSRHDPEAIVVLLPDLLVDKSPVVRRAAREAVPALGARSVPFLATALRTTTEVRRLEAMVEALSTTGPEAAPAVAHLTSLLAHPSALVVRSAADALGAIGESARCAIPDLLANFSDPRVTVRRSVVHALYFLAPLPSELFDRLPEMLRDEDSFVRSWARELSTLSGYEEGA